jgi:BirA family biotin operon repressor/biotin-[acetyl-CoA-carboxylase] ligase
MTLGKPVKIVTAAEEIRGVAVDVDDSGALLVEQADGTLQRVIYGDCFIR